MTSTHAGTEPVHAPPSGPVRRLLARTPVWLLIGVVGVALTHGATATHPVLAVLGALVALGIYWAVMTFLAGRRTPEIAGRGAWRSAATGVLIGLGFMVTSFVAVNSQFDIALAQGDSLGVLARTISLSIGAAVAEELIFRGLLLQVIERLLGSWAALAVTAALFGALHLANPHATLWSGMAIAVEAGVLLGAAFLWRRSLWLVIALHAAWNTVQGLLGIPVSGHADPGLLVVYPTGADLLTGGAFGIEASVVTVALGLAIAVPMLVAAHRAGNIRPRRAGLRSGARADTLAE